MDKLPLAIICTPTQEDANRLAAFINKHAADFSSKTEAEFLWEDYEDSTCYNVEHSSLCYCAREWYEDPENQEWMCQLGVWPEDPRYQFCSVDEYIALVNGTWAEEPDEESDIQFGSALADLL